MYKDDKQSSYRCSHENPYIQQVYEEFLEKPGSHKAHKLLHTHYEKKGNRPINPTLQGYTRPGGRVKE